jgi:hypothetical protein
VVRRRGVGSVVVGGLFRDGVRGRCSGVVPRGVDALDFRGARLGAARRSCAPKLREYGDEDKQGGVGKGRHL